MKKELIILSGFLGSGKTTLLRSLIARNAGRNMAILLNDFGETPVDGILLARDGVQEAIVEIGGGSVFCSCLTDTLVKTMFSMATMDVDLVLLEASGMSDPASIDKMLTLAGLDAHFMHTETICLFDPIKSLKLSHVLEVIPRQLASATLLVLSKADKYSPEQRQAARDYITTREPDLPIVESYHGELTSHEHDSCGASKGRRIKSAFSLSLNTVSNRPDSLQVSAITCPIAELLPLLEAEGILRSKGYVQAADGTWFISDTGTGIDVIESTENPVPLTIICLQGSGAALQEKITALTTSHKKG